MASAGHATPTTPTRTDAGALSAAKTPAFHPLNYDAATETTSISLKDLTDTWQKQCTYPQEADALVEEKRPARVRRCVAKGLTARASPADVMTMCVLRTFDGDGALTVLLTGPGTANFCTCTLV